MNVLIVDDDVIWARALARQVHRLGHTCKTASSPEEALRCLAVDRFALLITDVDLGGAYDGIDLACWAYNGLRLQVVIVTSGDQAWVLAGVLAMGGADIVVLSKGLPTGQLIARISEIAGAPAAAHADNDNGRAATQAEADAEEHALVSSARQRASS